MFVAILDKIGSEIWTLYSCLRAYSHAYFSKTTFLGSGNPKMEISTINKKIEFLLSLYFLYNFSECEKEKLKIFKHSISPKTERRELLELDNPLAMLGDSPEPTVKTRTCAALSVGIET